MTRRQIEAVQTIGAGPYRPARIRFTRGWTVVDSRTGRVAWLEINPTTGRSRPAMLPTVQRALAACRRLNAD